MCLDTMSVCGYYIVALTQQLASYITKNSIASVKTFIKLYAVLWIIPFHVAIAVGKVDSYITFTIVHEDEITSNAI